VRRGRGHLDAALDDEPLVLGRPPAALVQWWDESGTSMDSSPTYLAGVTRVGAPA
jgi:hypothetical protein